MEGKYTENNSALESVGIAVNHTGTIGLLTNRPCLMHWTDINYRTLLEYLSKKSRSVTIHIKPKGAADRIDTPTTEEKLVENY